MPFDVELDLDDENGSECGQCDRRESDCDCCSNCHNSNDNCECCGGCSSPTYCDSCDDCGDYTCSCECVGETVIAPTHPTPIRCCESCNQFAPTPFAPIVGSPVVRSREDYREWTFEDAKRSDGSQALSYTSNPLRLLRGELSPTTQYFGVELETEYERSSHRESVAKILYQYIWDKAAMKGDGSLNGSGIEIVSKPMELDDTKKYLFTLADALTTVPLEMSHRTGMHVHVSRGNLDNGTIGRMILFMHSSRPETEALIEYVAGRSLTTNHYCKLRTSQPHQEQTIFSREKRDWYQGDRYVALNCQNQNTLEFRIFNGTPNPHKLAANVEFCDSVIEWAKFTQDAARIVDIQAYLTFVRDSGKYPFLVSYFNQSESYRQREGSVAA